MNSSLSSETQTVTMAAPMPPPTTNTLYYAHRAAVLDDSPYPLVSSDGPRPFHGISYYRKWSLSMLTARILAVGDLITDYPHHETGANDHEELEDFLNRLALRWQHLTPMFHYTVYFVLRFFAHSVFMKIAAECHDYPAFVAKDDWMVYHTYCAVFLYVSRVYENPYRLQWGPTREDFHRFTGFSPEEQCDLFLYMEETVKRWPRLEHRIYSMARCGIFVDLTVKIGETFSDLQRVGFQLKNIRQKKRDVELRDVDLPPLELKRKKKQVTRDFYLPKPLGTAEKERRRILEIEKLGSPLKKEGVPRWNKREQAVVDKRWEVFDLMHSKKSGEMVLIIEKLLEELRSCDPTWSKEQFLEHGLFDRHTLEKILVQSHQN